MGKVSLTKIVLVLCITGYITLYVFMPLSGSNIHDIIIRAVNGSGVDGAIVALWVIIYSIVAPFIYIILKSDNI